MQKGAKTQAKAKNGKGKKGARARLRLPQQIVARLDKQAIDYARLLADPCNAPLSHPVYVGSEGGYLLRSSTYLTLGMNAGTTTAGGFFWIPGKLDCDGTVNKSMCYMETVNSATGGTWTASPQAQTPAAAFLATNAASVRIVAACISFTWAGTELNRQGLVGYGIVSGASILPAVVSSADSTLPLMQVSTRVPSEMVEFNFRPGNADQDFSSTNYISDPSNNDLSRSQAFQIAYKNLPANYGGIHLKLTAVYEYIPAAAFGVSNPAMSRNTSNNTFDQVVNYLDNTGAWFRGAARVGNAAMGAIASAYPVARGIAALTMG